MTPDHKLAPLAQQLSESVRQAISEIRPKLVEAALSGNRGESDNLRHADNFLSVP
jgi:myo-inositol-1(or 4)-monophosphatase